MAKMMPGSLAGALSGALGNDVFSHNRYGMYIRKRVIPTLRQTEHTLAARQRLIETSRDWSGLEVAYRAAWETFAAGHPITDRLGQRQVLTGPAAYIQLNTRILLAGGTKIEVPPAVDAPAGFLTFEATFDIGTGSTEITFTETPLGATDCLYLQAAVTTRPGVSFFKNLLKLCVVTDAAQASPYDWASAVESRFGSLAVGQQVWLIGSVLSDATGLLSAPSMAYGVVEETST